MAASAQADLKQSLEQPVDGARREILVAAAGCFMERGYSAASIDEVARRLGSTKGRIYHHYASKADLFADVFKAGMDMNYQAVMPVYESNTEPAAKLCRMAHVHTRQMIKTKPFQRAVWEGVEMHLRGSTTPEQRETLGELTAYRDRYGDMFKGMLSLCKQDGALSFGNLSIASQVMFVALNSPLFWYSPRPGEDQTDIDKLVGQVVTFALRGLGYQGEISS